MLKDFGLGEYEITHVFHNAHCMVYPSREFGPKSPNIKTTLGIEVYVRNRIKTRQTK